MNIAAPGVAKPVLSIVVDPAAQSVADAPPSLLSASTVEPQSGFITESAAASVKRAYPPPAELPTQEGARRLRFDFNDGCRVHLPESEHPWRVRLTDLDTGNVLFDRTQNRARQQQ